MDEFEDLSAPIACRFNRRESRDQAMAIKAGVDYQRLNKSFTDVTFIVGPAQHSKKYVGHRVLLAMTSPVFETMFYGEVADKSKYIRIPDVAPIGFENLLRYAYTDSLSLHSVEDAMMTAYAAKKYLLPQLLRECLAHIEQNMSPACACVVFEFAQVLNSQQLVLQAMNLMDRQTGAVIGSKSFAQVQPATVEFLANRKYLTLDEAGGEWALFRALISWCKHEARRRGIWLGAKNAPGVGNWLAIRSIMRETRSLGALRFLAMSNDRVARAILETSPHAQVTSDATSGGTPTELGEPTSGAGAGSPSVKQQQQLVDLADANTLLTETEQRAIFMNLSLPGSARMPPSLSACARPRAPPPDHFSVRRFGPRAPLVATTSATTSTRQINSIGAKFQCLNENVFIVALTIPLRLDATSYANRTPKFECHLKFTTKSTTLSHTAASSAQAATGSTGSSDANLSAPGSGANRASSPMLVSSDSMLVDDDDGETAVHKQAADDAGGSRTSRTGATPSGGGVLMDTIDESLHVSIARDRDCIVKLKRPILVRLGNLNELVLSFQAYALDEDIVALRTPKARVASVHELTDDEQIEWLFYRTPHIEFSEIHYYY